MLGSKGSLIRLSIFPKCSGASSAPRGTVSDALSVGSSGGSLRLYTRNLTDPPETVLRRSLSTWWRRCIRGALLADRSARLGGRPAEDGSVFLVHERSSETELPGLFLRPRKGPAAAEGDLPLPAGLHVASVPSTLGEHGPESGSPGAHRRVLSRTELEEWLESLIEQRGEDGFRQLRDHFVRSVATQLGLDTAWAALDPLIGAVLGTRRDVHARSSFLEAARLVNHTTRAGSRDSRCYSSYWIDLHRLGGLCAMLHGRYLYLRS